MTEVFLTWNHFIKQHPKKKSHLSTWPPISSGKAARGSGLPLGSLCGWPASQSPPTLCHPMVYSPPGSSVLGIFYQILIFAWKFKWYHWQQIILVIFLEATSLNCLIFKKMTKWLPDAQVWGSIIWLPVFQIKKKKSYEEVTGSVYNLNIPPGLLLKITPSFTQTQQKQLMYTSGVITQNIFKNVFQG